MNVVEFFEYLLQHQPTTGLAVELVHAYNRRSVLAQVAAR